MTFGMDPNEDPNAAPGSGNGVGTGVGGQVKITDPNAGATSGSPRTFDMRLPDNYNPNQPYWLIFAFHWNGGTGAQLDNGGGNGYWWSYYGLQRESNNGAIFVGPDGLNGGWYNTNDQDVVFTDDMVNLIEQNFCVDTTHIISSGFSFGAGMSFELACARANVFHAVVLYEGGQISGCDSGDGGSGGGTDPIAYMQIQGLTDDTVTPSIAVPARDQFVMNNGCTPQSALSQGPLYGSPPEPPPFLAPDCPSMLPGGSGPCSSPGQGHICYNYSGCSAGHPVRWCMDQGVHDPGPVDGTDNGYNPCATYPNTCSTSCPCSWTPHDVWTWLTNPSFTGVPAQTPNATTWTLDASTWYPK